MCEGQDFVKQDGVFVCQTCGCKYSAEDAKKMMIEGTVDIQGTVKIDSSDHLKNLYELAHRAKEEGNQKRAQKYYGQILEADASSWEAVLYTTYYDAMNDNVSVVKATAMLTNSEELLFNLIKDNVSGLDEQREAVDEAAGVFIDASNTLFQFYKQRYEKHWVTVQDYADTCSGARDLIYNAGNLIVEIFGDDFGELAACCWRLGVLQHNELNRVFVKKQYNADIIRSYIEKIKKYQPSYEPPKINMGACYVATCVYGAYDCPQVWTLRRYRDDTLGATWYGRLFIRTYYTVSPTLVKWFGKTNWFKKLLKGKLDRMVAKLQSKGVESTPYEDKNWR